MENDMAAKIKRKGSFGTITVDHISPPVEEEIPKAINVHVSFEEALKLHLGLGQLLGHLNGYNRKTKAGRRSGVNLCLFFDKHRITINEGLIRAQKKSGAPSVNSDLQED
jgi:hypothetical protein